MYTLAFFFPEGEKLTKFLVNLKVIKVKNLSEMVPESTKCLGERQQNSPQIFSSPAELTTHPECDTNHSLLGSYIWFETCV